jgi:hypothetical protein
VSFPWLTSNHGGTRATADRRLAVAQAELRDRAALFSRLGFPAADAARRLHARVAWDHESTQRPAALDDASITALVHEVYKRQRP